MATKTIEIAAYPGLTAAAATIRTDAAGDLLGTGTADSVALVAQANNANLYWAVITYTGTELLGKWSINVGVTNTLVDFVAGEDVYVLDASGGGASAEEIVDEFGNRGITTVAVQSGVTSSSVIELVQGDTYNGIGKPLLAFTVAVDYTDGWTASLTIRDEDDAVVTTVSGTVASATSITFSLTAPTGLTFTGCPGAWKGKFDVQMSKLTSRTTITRGVCYVYEDQTRT